MPYLIRPANRDDLAPLGALLEAYLRETYQSSWGGSIERLEQSLLGNEVAITLAETAGREVVGFIACVSSYDLHWCMKGGEVIDFYVCPEHRGRGAAMFLLVRLAADIEARGGAYLKGGAVESTVVRRLYRKIAMCLPDGQSYVSGRAFRALAALHGRSLREVVRNLPEPEWNHQP